MAWFDENAKIALVLALVVWMGLCYLKAYARVKRGDLVVYAGWGDFLKSVAWAILFPVGFFMYVSAINDHSAWSKGMAVVSVLLGVASVLWLIFGAFRYNRTIGDGFTALGARLLTALLALFVVAKVQEKLEKFGKGELDVVRGALIPLAVLGLVYRYGVRPMIGRRNDVGSLIRCSNA